jgi:DNA-directed RNA polymerase subunit RPC12/RpoP
MGLKGTFKFVCLHCGEELWLTRRDRDRRGHKICVNCGSKRFEPASDYAKDNIAHCHDGSHLIGERIKQKQGMVR